MSDRVWNVTFFLAGIQTGEDGVLSSPSSAFVKITANDDPNGLLKFSVPSVDIPEDFDPGNEASTHKNLTVLRNQGKWGTIKVRLWRHCHVSMSAYYTLLPW